MTLTEFSRDKNWIW